MPGGEVRKTLEGHTDMVTCLAISPSGRTLFSGSWDQSVRLWDVARGNERSKLTGHRDGIAALAQAPGGRELATAGVDKALRIWVADAPVLAPGASLSDLNAEVWAAAFAPDGQSLIWGGKSRDLLISDPPSAPGRVLVPGVGATWVVAFAPDGSTFATGGYYTDNAVKVWETSSKRLLHELKGHGASVRALAYAPDGKALASGSFDDKMVRLWDLANGKELAALPPLPQPVNKVQFLPDGKTLAIATGSQQAPEKPGELVLWNLAANTTDTRQWTEIQGHTARVTTLAVAADARTIATGSTDGIRLWDTDRYSIRTILRPDDPSVHSLAFSPDGQFLASGHYKGDVILWEAATGRKVVTLKGHKELVFTVAFSPDGRTLATCGRDKTLKLWALPVKSSAIVEK
jgi:WD40 repeat protein